MALRIWVTALIGTPGRLAGPAPPLLPAVRAGHGIRSARGRLTGGAARSGLKPRRQPMSLPGVWPQVLDFFGTPLVIEPSQGQLSSDAGLLPVRQFDQRIGLTRAFTYALDDPRDPALTEHSFLEMVRAR